ncbi:hypothetical protein CANARDRAFT_30105 [[Candida] arabinofermentans NRRL YB-2248]|uniref:Mediator of RNA polymerase II transcription subunit 21 n=1 Tax=[Candida] arabinofermentans NRRL YB-2248 TaxID=983967 RepID=A0A1E4SUZ8_9ASCO|nr:hypothetical protein CANARDRAFT_30105 [[Candida] arabinofermentans NRRL YB-2248]
MFFASLAYVDQNHQALVLSPTDKKVEDPDHHPPSAYDFQESLKELTTDIILKTRQILTIIDTLPGVGVSKEEQLLKIENLTRELDELELKKKKTILKKENLVDFVNELILHVSNGIAETRD